jgi:Domain of unknown function (DUF5916)/Carbohydrate family 9 binding domain-like
MQLVAQTGRDTLNFLPPAIPPSVFAVETTENMAIDGKLNEDVWQRAPVVDDFFRMEPRQGGSVQYATRVQVAFDKKNLYFGVFCKDSMGKKGVRVQDFRRDFIYGENDIFYLQLDPQNLKRYCVSFQTTPLSTQRDLQVFDDSFIDNDWDSPWRVRTVVSDSGYTAEFAIPFNTLRYDVPKDADSVSWGISFARLARRDYEQTVFPAVPQSFSPYRMNYAATLKGLKLPAPSTNLRFNPYFLYQYSDSKVGKNGANVPKNDLKIGGEAKWAINTHAVLDLTVNTDFAQADVDRAVNNLTRFNVFFPERRQFFLENSGVYAGADVDGVKPFFSRTIGLANSQFNADPVPIDAGARFTDRNQQRTIAAMYVHQRGTDNQAGANFGVMRYLKNYGKQNNIGAMVTHRHDENNTEKGYLQRNNTTVTVDGLIRPNDSWTIQYLASAARDNGNDSIGFAGNFFVGYFPNKWYLGWVTKFVDEKYVPGMGFVFANNTIHHNPGGYHIWRPKGKLGKIIRRWDPGVFVNYYQNADNLAFQSAQLDIFPVYIVFQDNSLLDVTYHPTWENFFFSPLGFEVKPDNYFFNRFEIRYRTDASKKISGDISFYGGKYYDGSLDEWSANLRLAPSPKIALTGSYNLNRIRNLGTQKVNEDIAIYTVGCRLAANPRMQLSAFYQYNTFDERGRWNVRGSWEFAPLSFVYLVFNENDFRQTDSRNRSVINKISYLRQF